MDDVKEQFVSGVISSFAAEAAEHGITLHDSFKIELLNYSRHEGVRELSDSQLNLILTEIGRRAIRRSREKQRDRAQEVPGGDVRETIMQLCKTWKHCYGAAEEILTNPVGYTEGVYHHEGEIIKTK
jgi:hypothetical protein